MTVITAKFANFAENNDYNPQMNLIERTVYLDDIEKKLGRNMIICLTGQRRVGKSSILRTLADRFSGKPDHNVVFIDKEKAQFDTLKTYEDLNTYLDSRLLDHCKNIVMIDEVQMIAEFQRSLCNYYDRGNVELVVTGSNAKMFSGELATLLGGRYLRVHVGSLSYREFLQFHDIENTDQALWSYLNFGGMPNLRLISLDDAEGIGDYLQSIYNTVVLKDIVQRENIRTPGLLDNLSRFVSDNIGKLFSPSRISKYLLHEGEDFKTDSVRKYMQWLANAYLINKVPRWDIHGKELLSTQEKYYFEDLGLRNILSGGNRSTDIEKIIENAVYLHLRSLGYDVKVGVLRNGEVDFVASKGAERIYVQATYLLASEETYNREFGNLKLIQDNYPKFVVSMDPFLLRHQEDGIIHIGLRDFLMRSSL